MHGGSPTFAEFQRHLMTAVPKLIFSSRIIANVACQCSLSFQSDLCIFRAVKRVHCKHFCLHQNLASLISSKPILFLHLLNRLLNAGLRISVVKLQGISGHDSIHDVIFDFKL